MNSAIGKTSANGTVYCADSGAYLAGNITKSVTVDCSDQLLTNVSPNGLSIGALQVDLATDEHVVLRGLNLYYPGGAATLRVAGAGTVIVDRSVITGSRNASASSAISIEPTGALKVTILDSLISGGGNATTGAGIRINPASGGTAQVTINNSKVVANTFGIAVDGSSSTGGINATIVDSLMSDNKLDGLIAVTSSSGAPIGVTVANSQTLNNGFGIRSIGSNVTVRSEGTKIIGNGVGLSGGGVLLTGGGNTVQANGTNGGFTGSYPLQ